MPTDEDDRIESEILLLEAMYPGQVTFDRKAREVKYTTDQGSLELRLPAGYLKDELPEVISASLTRKDYREALKKQIERCPLGEEVLDSVISAFNDLSDEVERDNQTIKETNGSSGEPIGQTDKATVAVWLHHLLNTNKRKQALSPPSAAVSGITKPGYPGVLIYSGPANPVNEHVSELRQLNWQAFSVRLESDEEWAFKHGTGVKEFESMKEVVADISEDRKEMFMEAMRMK